MEWLLKNGVLKEQTAIKDIITNALIDDNNAFDPAEIAALAKDYKAN
jgi:hypothetical protein